MINAFIIGLVFGFIIGLIFFAKILDTPEYRIGKIKRSNISVSKKRFKLFKRKEK